MSYFPGFNPGAMSEDQLLEKYTELSRKLVWAARFSGSGEIIEQIQAMISMIESEKRDRLLLEVHKMREKMFPAVIESDPSLIPNPEKDTKESDKKKTIARDRNRMLRKSKSPDNGA